MILLKKAWAIYVLLFWLPFCVFCLPTWCGTKTRAVS